MATEHFSDVELVCHCGCGKLPSRGDQEYLEAFRVFFGEPMHLSSAYRCPKHNMAVSDTGPGGPHTRFAVDILCFGATAYRLIAAAVQPGMGGVPWWTGIGVSQKGPHRGRFIHLDMLEPPGFPRPWIWSY